MPVKDVQDAKMNESEGAVNSKNIGGRRRLPDRRQFSSSEHFPERRNLRYVAAISTAEICSIKREEKN